MVLVHKACVVSLGPPQVKRRVLTGLVCALQRVIAQKTRGALGFFFPDPAVRPVRRNVLFLNSKKNEVNEQSTELSPNNGYAGSPRFALYARRDDET